MALRELTRQLHLLSPQPAPVGRHHLADPSWVFGATLDAQVADAAGLQLPDVAQEGKLGS